MLQLFPAVRPDEAQRENRECETPAGIELVVFNSFPAELTDGALRESYLWVSEEFRLDSPMILFYQFVRFAFQVLLDGDGSYVVSESM